MQIVFTNFQIAPTRQITNKKENNNNNNIKQTTAPSFEGTRKIEPTIYSTNIIPIFKNPAVYMQNRLTNDGYNSDDIKTWDIYSIPETDDTETGAKAFEKDYKKYIMRVQTRDILSKTKKPAEDIAAMSRVYSRLKNSFENEDTKEYSEAFENLGKVMEEKLGVQMPKGKPVQDLILETLSYTNRYNELLIYRLLDDKNFNNINIPQAISNIQTKQDGEAALSALREAKKTKYDKNFSLPLSIILSNATPENMPVIKKALTEQEYLTNAKDFVPQRLKQFLQSVDLLAITYMKDESMSLEDVNEIMADMEKYSE